MSVDALKKHAIDVLDFLNTARPTAVNLGTAVSRLKNRLQASASSGKDARAIARDLVIESREIELEDVCRNKEMSKLGAEWLVARDRQNGGTGTSLNVLTVCNTGSLATSVRVDPRLGYPCTNQLTQL
jgi:methylthioribose-1-phosphate isomerase